MLSTGTQLPDGESLRARLLVLNVRRWDVKWDGLALLQELAAQGKFATATAGYLRWLAAAGGQQAEYVRTRHIHLRPSLLAVHQRTSDTIGSLALGLERFLQFAEQVGAIDEARRLELWVRGWSALAELGDAQAPYTGGSAA